MFGLFTNPSDLAPSQGAILRRIERKLDLIIEHLGIESADAGHELPREAREFADSGQAIEAIRAYRQTTGEGLKEAKEAVDRYMAGRRRGDA